MATNKQKKLKIYYDSEADALSMVVKDGAEDHFEELSPGISVEYDRRGNVLGFEILNASRHFRATIPKMAEFLQSERKISTVSWSLVSCIDTGTVKETLPKLFQKFSRAEDASKANVLGTGLGLYVVKKLLEAQNGTIWAESEGEGKGSMFSVELPLKM